MNFDWMGSANCAGMPLEVFFRGKGESIKEARAVCNRCDVRLDCLEWAMTHPATDLHNGGVLAGLAPAELAAMRARRRDEEAAA